MKIVNKFINVQIENNIMEHVNTFFMFPNNILEAEFMASWIMEETMTCGMSRLSEDQCRELYAVLSLIYWNEKHFCFKIKNEKFDDISFQISVLQKDIDKKESLYGISSEAYFEIMWEHKNLYIYEVESALSDYVFNVLNLKR